MQREFRFRLNGRIMPEIFVGRAMVNGEPLGEWQIAVDIDGLGRFSIDDNSTLWDDSLPKFVLEYRDETAWALLPSTEKRASKDKGWKTVIPQELLRVLETAGYIACE
jgi:hypothetical protein